MLLEPKSATLHHTPMTQTSYPPESMEAIGSRLRLTRRALGLTTKQFCKAVGFGITQLENYEAGRRLMKPQVAICVIRAFPAAKLDFNWLYHGDLGGVAHDFAMKVQEMTSPGLAA